MPENTVHNTKGFNKTSTKCIFSWWSCRLVTKRASILCTFFPSWFKTSTNSSVVKMYLSSSCIDNPDCQVTRLPAKLGWYSCLLPHVHLKSLVNHFYQLAAIRRKNKKQLHSEQPFGSYPSPSAALPFLLVSDHLTCCNAHANKHIMSVASTPQLSKFSWLSVAGGGGDGYNGLHQL